MKENLTEQTETTEILLARLERLLLQREKRRLRELQAERDKLVEPMQEAEKVLAKTSKHYHLAEQQLLITQLAIDRRKQQIERLTHEKLAA